MSVEKFFEALLAADAPDDPLARFHVLVVDGESSFARALSTRLDQGGRTVAYATSSEAALSSITAQPPALALIAIDHMSFDGFELARELRRRTGGDAAVLVALGEETQPNDIAPFDLYMTKPSSTQHWEGLFAWGRK